ncbi:hypothetical protein [endosymbiont GvMRE of Glomus versiforme]|uniref:hypothetical protein n=1 Tax=endosymbiont GvMRE of Glomus versiforme TaxID=2039283 RepID=UPI000ED2DDCF|nr:hypothetical protein [endosymbiont GvMRE of Glomus versiforme]RHZ36655.1 hypothetical protein GvMRE_I2g95 [endosymbiont GvMRE of Glomus versiforme]
MEKIEKCDRCRRDFARKFVAPQNKWSQINEVSFWTDNQEKTWKGHRLLCRACLKDWRQNYPDDYLELVSSTKKARFRSYLYSGLFDKKDLVEKRKIQQKDAKN